MQPAKRLAPRRLAGSWAKLDRAHGHVDDLRRAIMAACDGKGPPRVLSTRRQFNPKDNMVLWIAERVPEIGDDWGLMIGDAVHNLRCALDHLWWQLAIDNLGRKPTDDEAWSIQFPILTFKTPKTFRSHRFLKYVSTEAADIAERIQGYDIGEDETSFLTVLADLSNHDKHREIRPTFFMNTQTSIPIHPLNEVMIDCELPIEQREGKQIFEPTIAYSPNDRPAPGDVVAGIQVKPTGPNPDIDVEPEATGEIVLGEEGYAFRHLDVLGRATWKVLNEFAPILRSPDA